MPTFSVDQNLELGADALEELLRRLSGGAHDLADPYAEAMLAAARSAAGGHPTPQARMAASGLSADHGAILAPAGAIVSGRGGRPAQLAEIIAGAEWGSDTFRQFAGRNSRGYWLIPSADADSTLAAGDRALADILATVTR